MQEGLGGVFTKPILAEWVDEPMVLLEVVFEFHPGVKLLFVLGIDGPWVKFEQFLVFNVAETIWSSRHSLIQLYAHDDPILLKTCLWELNTKPSTLHSIRISQWLS